MIKDCVAAHSTIIIQGEEDRRTGDPCRSAESTKTWTRTFPAPENQVKVLNIQVPDEDDQVAGNSKMSNRTYQIAGRSINKWSHQCTSNWSRIKSVPAN